MKTRPRLLNLYRQAEFPENTNFSFQTSERSTHLKPLKHDKNVYLPNQPLCFTDDNLDDWAPGNIDSNDTPQTHTG